MLILQNGTNPPPPMINTQPRPFPTALLVRGTKRTVRQMLGNVKLERPVLVNGIAPDGPRGHPLPPLPVLARHAAPVDVATGRAGAVRWSVDGRCWCQEMGAVNGRGRP